MYRKAESGFDLLGQRPSMYRAIALKPFFDEGHDLGSKFVRSLGPPRSGQQAGQAVVGERRFGLIQGRPRHAEQGGGVDFRCAVDSYMPKHLVLRLHQVMRIEEIA